MNIDDPQNPGKVLARTSACAAKTLEKTRTRQRDPGSSRADSVHLSPRAREYRKARQALAALPDIEADKVREIKARIQNDSYRPDADQIAAKMIREALSNDD